MKLIFRIIIILLAATIIAAGWTVVANNNSLASGGRIEGGPPAGFANEEGKPISPPSHFEGGKDFHGTTRGLSGLLITIAKLGVIVILVIVLQKAVELFGKLKPARG